MERQKWCVYVCTCTCVSVCGFGVSERVGGLLRCIAEKMKELNENKERKSPANVPLSSFVLCAGETLYIVCKVSTYSSHKASN